MNAFSDTEEEDGGAPADPAALLELRDKHALVACRCSRPGGEHEPARLTEPMVCSLNEKETACGSGASERAGAGEDDEVGIDANAARTRVLLARQVSTAQWSSMRRPRTRPISSQTAAAQPCLGCTARVWVAALQHKLFQLHFYI